jgi:hypothetical protein
MVESDYGHFCIFGSGYRNSYGKAFRQAACKPLRVYSVKEDVQAHYSLGGLPVDSDFYFHFRGRKDYPGGERPSIFREDSG